MVFGKFLPIPGLKNFPVFCDVTELRIVASTASMLEEQGRRQVRNAYQVIYT